MAEQYVIDFEEWRPAHGWPDYEISSHGRLRRSAPGRGVSRVGRIIKPQRRSKKKNYPIFLLHRRGKNVKLSVHQVVAKAFLEDPPTPEHQIAHWDGNPHNNRVSNLRWATPLENSADTIRHGHSPRGERNVKNVLTKTEVLEIRSRYQAGISIADLCREYPVKNAAIWKICHRRTWAWL